MSEPALMTWEAAADRFGLVGTPRSRRRAIAGLVRRKALDAKRIARRLYVTTDSVEKFTKKS